MLITKLATYACTCVPCSCHDDGSQEDPENAELKDVQFAFNSLC